MKSTFKKSIAGFFASCCILSFCSTSASAAVIDYNETASSAQIIKTDNSLPSSYSSKDMGYVTENGNVYVDGRISSSYENAAGETIYLFDVERAILDLLQVRQCKVVVSDVDGEKTHVAHIVLTKDADKKTTMNSIKRHCACKLPINHIPTLVKIYDSALPVAPSGKLNVVQMESDTKDLIKL